MDKKYNQIVGGLLLVCLGIVLLYIVFVDFIKAVVVAAGIFLLRAGFSVIMEELGNPDKKIIRKAVDYFRK